jgi:phosphatidate cytidylyltransferase
MSDAETKRLKPKFEGLLQRVRSALVLLPFVIVPVVYGGWLFSLLLAIAGFFMAREWAALLNATPRQSRMLGYLTVLLLAYGQYAGPAEALAMAVVLGFAALAICAARGVRATPLAGGLVYVALPLLVAQYFRLDPLGMGVIGYVLVSVWAVDIFAMFSGKIIGGPKLAPVISPNKTWAGMFGAVLGAVVGAALTFVTIVGFGFATLDFRALLIIAPVLAVTAQVSDLFESALKRKYDIKDSGALIPGHGGLLDRVDGLIGVLLALWIVTLVRGGDVSTALWVW